uniref:Uncharacterized protein n=1 Tax=Spongospora subterranea TaxID=70186 RepID=A0A0H5R050_9EUKA|eukprot:CRZ07504.1 hypothetical protein [Spongospora subterranea]
MFAKVNCSGFMVVILFIRAFTVFSLSITVMKCFSVLVYFCPLVGIKVVFVVGKGSLLRFVWTFHFCSNGRNAGLQSAISKLFGPLVGVLTLFIMENSISMESRSPVIIVGIFCLSANCSMAFQNLALALLLTSGVIIRESGYSSSVP